MLLAFDLTRLAAAIAAIALGIAAPWRIDDSPQMAATLTTFGIALLVHQLFFAAVALGKSREPTFCAKVSVWLNKKLDPDRGSKTVKEHRFALEGDKQLLTWLMTASGIIIGLVGFSQSSVAQDTQKLGAGALVVAIVGGIMYINIVAGGVSAEDHFELTVEKFNQQLGVIMLNIAYWSFALGVLAIFFGIVALPNK